jgi:pimeloyl-ACP methyl ester carboxylesterase
MTRQHPAPEPAIPLDEWARRGVHHRIFGDRIFAVDTGPKPGVGAPVLVLHGFPSSSLDFRPALPRLAHERRVILMWEDLIAGGGRKRLAAVAGYMNERVRFRERWIGALTRLDVPAHILWGGRDPVALPAVARALAAEIPGAKATWLDELGHYPMLEAPDRWAAAALAFLDEQAR